MLTFDTLKDLSHETLLNQFSKLVFREKEITAQVIAYLAEVRKRRLYAQEGYSSLFSFLTEKYRYSKGAAYRRIQAAKVTLLFPEVLEFLASGKLQLISLCLIEPHLTPANGKDLLSKIIGKSKEEIEYELAALFPKAEKNRDKIRRLPVVSSFPEEMNAQYKLKETPGPVINAFVQTEPKEKPVTETNLFHSGTKDDRQIQDNGRIKDRFHSETDSEKVAQKNLVETELKPIRRVKIEFVADEAVAELIERARALLSHKYPKLRLEDLMREAFQALLEKKDPMKVASHFPKENDAQSKLKEKSTGTHDHSVKSLQSRYIPVQVKREVWSRDEGRCTFVNIEGKRCDERLFLELDHIQAFALGGKTTTSNLRLFCSTHNQWRSEQMFNYKKSRDQA